MKRARRGWWWGILFLAGCQSLPPAEPTGLTAESFWKDQKSRATAWKYLGGKLDLSLASPKEKVSGGGRFLLAPPDGIYLDIRDPFGRTHYNLATDKSHFTAYYPRHRLAYRDETQGKLYFARFLGIPIAARDLVDLWLGVIPAGQGVKSFARWEWDAGARGYRGTRGQVSVVVDGHTAALLKLELETGGQKIVVNYSPAQPCCGDEMKVALARTVEVQTGNGATRLEIGMDSLALAAPPAGNAVFRLSLPADTQKILLNK